MDLKSNVRRATSAGYRLPDKPAATFMSQASVSASKPSRKTPSTANGKDRNHDTDPVKQDQVWREFVRAEMTGAKEWQKNWSFLKNYDQLGEPRPDSPLPNHVPLYSDSLPNTANQMFGSRLCTQLGRELMRMDRMLSGGHHRCKQSLDMLPC